MRTNMDTDVIYAERYWSSFHAYHAWYLPLVRNAWEVTKRKRICTNAIQPETLGNIFSSNLEFISDPSQVFRFLVHLTKITFWASKSGFSYPDRSCVGIRGFSSKIGIIPTKLGWLDTLDVICDFFPSLSSTYKKSSAISCHHYHQLSNCFVCEYDLPSI